MQLQAKMTTRNDAPLRDDSIAEQRTYVDKIAWLGAVHRITETIWTIQASL